jgi:hypothetical protein
VGVVDIWVVTCSTGGVSVAGGGRYVDVGVEVGRVLAFRAATSVRARDKSLLREGGRGEEGGREREVERERERER